MNSLNTKEDKLNRTRIILASCYPLILQALKINMEKQQDMEVVAETGDSEEAVNLTARLRPDIVIIDIDMPGIDGLEATKRIIERRPGTKVLVLTCNGDSKKVQQAGASGYLSKRAPIELIFRVVRDMATGKSTFAQQYIPEIIRGGFHNIQPLLLDKLDQLTERELTTLKLVAKGKSNKDIALKLGLSLANAKATLTSIYLKLHVSSRTEAISAGLKSGILSLGDFNQ